MKKRVISFIITVLLISGLCVVQASVKPVDTQDIIIDGVFPCKNDWELPPECSY